MKIAVLLSGGVDSSLALRLLHEEGGHELTAFYLKIWLEDELAFLGDCPWEEDLGYARSTCAQLGIPLEIIPLQSEYLEKVVEHALSKLRAGRTPSPDIFCNQRIKFGEFFRRIDPSYEKVASGHYAQIEEGNGTYQLKRAPDLVKDQTYFLSNLDQQQLSRALFPIGHLHKKEVRDLALDFDLPAKERKDSQGICFLGKINYRDFVQFHLGEKEGEIREFGSGKLLGEHRGFWFYTIGQRFGLGLSGGPWYVTEKDVENNLLYVAHRNDWKPRNRYIFTVADVNWVAREPEKVDLQIKLRHGPDFTDGRISPLADGRLEVALADPDPGIAPGQHAVFYDDQICLGGGVICD
ncbi:MAG: tRNA 2-thiouridine(34) synthase MnmA [Gemmatimonadetes bacterium]|jgi:tRNA-5-taurinomethyluridine 2-sulfurtransferase|nr:tRNA 2-thiouridine(34) synthase MnmA [Gemmatimonadota bacterium]